jgi:hypothetical protein
MERSALSCRQSLFGRAVCRMTTLLLAAGLLTVAGLPLLRPAARQFVSRITPDRLATKFSTGLAISDPGVVILDVRPGAAYRGETGKASTLT